MGDQFNKILEIEQEKQAEQKEKKKKNKSNNMFHNIINRQLGNANAMTRLKGQGQLIHLTKSIQEIDIGQLSEHLKHIHDLNEAMDVVHNTLSKRRTVCCGQRPLLHLNHVYVSSVPIVVRYQFLEYFLPGESIVLDLSIV